eukprot:1160559-Pelagomonas_calceolata.AAC.12
MAYPLWCKHFNPYWCRQAVNMCAERHTPVISRLSSKWSLSMPSKHFLRCGCTRVGSWVINNVQGHALMFSSCNEVLSKCLQAEML